MNTMIIKNANVIDMKNDTPHKSDVYIEEGVIKEIGPDLDKDAETVDATGRYLIPGFIDTHSHILLYGLYKSLVDVTPGAVSNIPDIQNALGERVQNTPAGEWIVAHGYNELELQEGRHITKDELDDISSVHPIYLRHNSQHMGVANARAFEIAGISADTPDPAGGYFDKTDNQLNGLLFELPAVNMMLPFLPKPSTGEMSDALDAAAEDYIKKGITTATEACVGLAYGTKDYKAFTEHIKNPDHPMNLRMMIDYKLLEAIPELNSVTFDQLNDELKDLSSNQCVLDSAKFFQDGSIQINTAALTEHYYNVDDKSDIIIPQDELEALYQRFAGLGYPLTTHGNGDKAIKSIISAYAKLNSSEDYHKKTRVEHIQTGEYRDIQTMKENDIEGSFFTNHLYYFGDLHHDRFLGPKRANQLNPARWGEDAGILYTLHSDAPVTPISPLDNITIACDRQTKSGRILGEDLKLTRFEALKAMTINAARLNETDDENGTIETGKTADLVILSDNPLDETVELSDDMIEKTIIDGAIIHNI